VQAWFLEQILPIGGTDANARDRAFAGEGERHLHTGGAGLPDPSKKIRKTAYAMVRDFDDEVADLNPCLLRGSATGKTGYDHVPLYLGGV